MDSKVQNTQQGICFISINGTDLKLRFGIPACKEISALLIGDVDQVYFKDDAFTEVGIAKLLYYGYWNECIVQETKQVLTIDDFMNYVEDKALEGDYADITTASKAWADSKATQKFLVNADKAAKGYKEGKKK